MRNFVLILERNQKKHQYPFDSIKMFKTRQSLSKDEDSNWYRLLVRESLHILAKQPKLNKTVSSLPLIIYPEDPIHFVRD
jgi:hypothetical protein